jgi:MFS transporter, Spinster family, sphingosine-1-phosphate transporter
MKLYTTGFLLFIFASINFFNYVDRGIIPGCPVSISEFIEKDMNVNGADLYIGLLQSSFIIGYSLSCVGFGYAAHRFKNPFHLVVSGLIIWLFAVILSAVSPHYYILAIARGLSGVGEASFQAVIPPYLDDISPTSKRGLYLSIYYSAIPVGTAVGYAYGGVVAQAFSWRVAFWFECLPVLFLLPLLWFAPNLREQKAMSRKNDEDDIQSSLLQDSETDVASNEVVQENGKAIEYKHPSFINELRSALTNPLYVCIVLGYASFTAVTSGLGSFGPIFAIGFRFFSDQSQASLAFGLSAFVAGIIGTPLGGLLLDYGIQRKIKYQKEKFGDDLHENLDSTSPEMLRLKLTVGMMQCTILVSIGIMFLFGSVILVQAGTIPFFLCGTVGLLLIFMSTSATNLCMMASVDASSRSFAIGLGTLAVHALGDVPSPPIIGLMIDYLSPCEGSGTCVRSVQGLQICLGLVSLWLLWTVVFWGCSWYLSLKRPTTTKTLEGGLSSGL